MNRRRLFRCGINISQAEPLEVAFYNGSEIVIRKESEWKDGETPIGIVVVPGYHNRYGDGTCGIMSLVEMDYDNPETGKPVYKSEQKDSRYMYWGIDWVTIGNCIFSSTTSNEQNYRCIPYQISADSTATTVYNSKYVIWPYDGTSTSLTPAKSETSDVVVPSMSATSGHAFGDFNGIKNTAACYVKTRTNSQWTNRYIQDDTKETSPAVACAGRFKTVGTKSFYDVYSEITSGNVDYGTIGDNHKYKGMWYLPSAGELSYLPSKVYEINKTINALNSKYGNVGTLLVNSSTSNAYWSSTDYDSPYVWTVNLNKGFVNKEARGLDSGNYVRAFMRL